MQEGQGPKRTLEMAEPQRLLGDTEAPGTREVRERRADPKELRRMAAKQMRRSPMEAAGGEPAPEAQKDRTAGVPDPICVTDRTCPVLGVACETSKTDGLGAIV